VVQVLRCFARLFVRLGSDSLPNPSTTTFAICKASGVRFERIFFSWLDLRGLEHRSYMRRVDEILLLLLTCPITGRHKKWRAPAAFRYLPVDPVLARGKEG
jgi:hypothetical protein